MIFFVRFRCFIYDTWERNGESGFKVAKSGDATCNGLFSINDGSQTLKLTKGKRKKMCLMGYFTIEGDTDITNFIYDDYFS